MLCPAARAHRLRFLAYVDGECDTLSAFMRNEFEANIRCGIMAMAVCASLVEIQGPVPMPLISDS